MKKYLFAVLLCMTAPLASATGNPDLFRGLLVETPKESRITLVVELQRGTMTILNTYGDEIDVIEQVPVSIGKNGFGKQIEGDKRTPVGIYEIISFLKDEDLPERYGPGAFILDYPNIWDKRKERTGSGIWIHGIDRGLKARPYLDSDGCVVIDNSQFDRLRPLLDLRPEVILTHTIPPVDQSYNANAKQMLKDWEAAWESLDVEQYLAFYGESFANASHDLRSWSAHKRRVGAHKTKIDVTLSNVSIVRYPNESNLVRVEFKQRYVSNNYSGSNNKRQFWRQDAAGSWKIIYEDSF